MVTEKKFPLDITIVPAYCQRSHEHLFGIRTEKMDGVWVMNWAFKMTPRHAANEKYLNNSIGGQIAIANEYPGCPYCGTKGFYQCPNCSKIVCCETTETQVTCPSCGSKLSLVESDAFDKISTGKM